MEATESTSLIVVIMSMYTQVIVKIVMKMGTMSQTMTMTTLNQYLIQTMMIGLQ